MRIEIRKFGDILTSREAGREAFLAISPTLKSLDKDEKIIIDFQGVSVVTPSWADEFIQSIFEKYPNKVFFINDANPSVQAALRFADPKLNLREMTVYKDVIVFDEEGADEKIFKHRGKAQVIFTFPYSDEQALRILTKNEVKKIYVYSVDTLDNARLQAVIRMLKQAGIEAIINKKSS